MLVLIHIDRMLAQSGGVLEPMRSTNRLRDCIALKHFTRQIENDSLRHLDVMVGGVIWRVIEGSALRTTSKGKQNDCQSADFFELILCGLLDYHLEAFGSDEFKRAAANRLSTEEIESRLFVLDTLSVKEFDANGEMKERVSHSKRRLGAYDIVGYVCKEDWVMNAKSGQMQKRIIALAPLVQDPKTQQTKVLFWLYYNEWRNLFGLFTLPGLSAENFVSYEEVFDKHLFVSRISQEKNIYNRPLQAYKHGDDAVMESELIKEKIQNMESDLFPH